MEVRAFVDEVRVRVAALRVADAELRSFGAYSHRWLWRRRLSEVDCAVAEKRWGVSVPEHYRALLVELGNGGAGPYYGLMPLLGADRDRPASDYHYPIHHAAGYAGHPGTPFPHTDAWAPYPDTSAFTPAELNALEDEVFDSRHIDGALPVADVGCGYTSLLVVNGPCCGEVWDDGRPNDMPIQPYRTTGGERMDFATWYLDGLTRAEAELTKLRDDPAYGSGHVATRGNCTCRDCPPYVADNEV